MSKLPAVQLPPEIRIYPPEPPTFKNLRGAPAKVEGFQDFEMFMCRHDPAYAASFGQAHDLQLTEVERLQILLWTMATKAAQLDDRLMQFVARAEAQRQMNQRRAGEKKEGQ